MPDFNLRYAGAGTMMGGTKPTRSQARYTPAGGRERCGQCRHFVPASACNRIVGPVSAMGWCSFFSREMAVLLQPGATYGGGLSLPSLALDFLTPGSLDPSITFTRASIGTYFDITGTMQTATANTPRWDYDPVTHALRGLLLEDARTNIIPNPRGEGAAAGSPGTDPTGWAASVGLGLTKTTAIGTELGIPYVQYRYNSAAATAGNTNITLSATGLSGLPVTAAATITMSMYVSFPAGSFTNVQGFTLRTNQYNSSGTSLGALGSTTFNFPSMAIGDAITKIRAVWTVALNASAAFVQPFIQIPSLAGAVDFTMRFGGLQFETGGNATAVILPTAGSPAASTRAVDVANITPLGAWFNASTGTLAIEFDSLKSAGVAGGFSSGAAANVFNFTGNQVACAVASTAYNATGSAVSYTGVTQKMGGAYAVGRVASCNNGGAVATNATLPAGPYPWTSNLTIGNNPSAPSGAASMCGHARRVQYWNTALSDAQLQQVTT